MNSLSRRYITTACATAYDGCFRCRHHRIERLDGREKQSAVEKLDAVASVDGDVGKCTRMTEILNAVGPGMNFNDSVGRVDEERSVLRTVIDLDSAGRQHRWGGGLVDV
jgi:hypothetical protein